MASYQDILKAFADATGPVSASDIANKLKTKVNLINTSLTRCVSEKGWLKRDDDGNYSLTEEGAAQLNPLTEEGEKVTEFQVCLDFGIRVGVPEDQAKLTTEHIWRGGDWRDLKWVWQGLVEQNIRSDLAKRWWHNWRSYLHQAVPPELEIELGPAKPAAAKEAGASAESKEAAASKGKRDYILGPDDTPIQVGEGLGDLDYEDALALSKVRMAAQARAAAYGGGAGNAQSVESLSETIANVWKTFNEATGGNGKGKSVIIIPSEEGYRIQELGGDQPLVLPSPGSGQKPSPQWVVEPDGTTRQLQPGEPVVIKPAAPLPPSGNIESPKQYLIHPDGTYEEVKAGTPVIIRQEGPKNAGGTYINAVTKDGQPFVIDLESYFKLEDHKAKNDRDQESHELKMDTLKAFKDLVVKGGRALANMEEG